MTFSGLISLKLVILLILACVNSVRSDIALPKAIRIAQTPLSFRSNSPPSFDEDIPIQSITITEGAAVDLPEQSNSSISINLNRAIAQNISVFVQVFSGPGIIVFVHPDNPNSTYSENTTITYKANTFGDQEIPFRTTSRAGHAEVVCKILVQPNGTHIDDSSSYISVNVYKSFLVNTLISIVGWIYFFAWSLSFYFQVILNYQRKSVEGLNYDFLALNLLGFTCYSIYNLSLMFSRTVQRQYYERNEYSRIPVEWNDVFFSLHALLLSIITIAQCFIYERGEQDSTKVGKALAYTSRSFTFVSLMVGFLLFIIHLFDAILILDVLLYLSYVKLAVTIIKYTPQAYMNYSRKSTTGWSIHNILLDFTGGAFSLAQMFLISYNYDDWISIFGNFAKFGLGIISIAFDTLFFLQHYVLYRRLGRLNVSTESIPSPVISDSIRSATQHQDSGSNSSHLNK